MRGGISSTSGSSGGGSRAKLPRANKEGMERIRIGRINNTIIGKYENLEDLLAFVDANVQDFNCVNFSTAMHRIGKLNKPVKNRRNNTRVGNSRGQPVFQVNEDRRFHKLEKAIEAELVLHEENPPPLEDGRGQFGVRETSSVLWGLANSGCTLKELTLSAHAPRLLESLLNRLISFDGEEFACQNLSNAIWAIATMHQDEDDYLPMETIRVLETHVCDTIYNFIPQGVSNCLWAFGSLNKNKGFAPRPETVARFGEGILLNKDGFKSMEMSNIVWAVSTLRLEFPAEVIAALDDAVCNAIETQPEFFSSQSVSNILWAAGNHPEGMPLSKRLLHSLAEMSYAKFSTFTPQGLSNTAWGFASVGYNPGAQFLDALRQTWAREGHTYIVTECANLLWAFQNLKEDPGIESLRVVSERMLDLPEEDMHVQTIANMMYSLAQFEYLPHRDTMERLEDTCVSYLRRPHEEIAPHILSNLLWAFGTLKYKPGEEFFSAFNARCLRMVRDFTDQGVSNLICTYANLDVNPGRELLDSFAEACELLMNAFTPQGVANTIWAWAVLDYWPSPELVSLYRRRLALMRADKLTRIDLIQLFQASLAFEHFSPYGAVLEGELLQKSRAAWEQNSSGRVTISAMHRGVSEALTRLGVPHEIEFLTRDKFFSVDIALRGRKVAVEVDGPSHFFANKLNERVGGDKLREQYLEYKGWTVRNKEGFSLYFTFFFFSFSFFKNFFHLNVFFLPPPTPPCSPPPPARRDASCGDAIISQR